MSITKGRPVVGFYSALSRAVEQGNGAPRRATADAWKGWLDGAQRRGEFRAGERAWSGVDTWLDAQKRPVTREELAAFVRANEVGLEEVVGDPNKSMGSSDFMGWKVPGGENYRELLLTLPFDREAYAKSLVDPAAWDRMSDEQRQQFMSAPVRGDGKTTYKSSHWDQPNVVAHVRFDERTDADGKRVLFINEIQSDWHQEGRKRGYRTPKQSHDLVVQKIGAGWEVYNRALERTAQDDDGNDAIFASRRDAEAMREQILRDPYEAASAVPDAPLKQTDEWAMLAFKRMARWAVDNGFDRVAWLTGEQAAELFGLSKQVESIVANPRENGAGEAVRRVGITMKGGSTIVFDVDSSGVVANTSNANAGLRGKPLDQVVGKEMAEKIIGVEERQEFTDADLKLGSEGMRGFYDKILPAAVSKWAQKFGGEVGQIGLPDPDSRIGRWRVWLPIERDQYHQTFATRGEAEAVAKLEGGEVMEPLEANAPIPGHAIDITPAMREAVAEGQPMFRREVVEDTAGRSAEPFYSAALRAIGVGKGAPRRAPATSWRQWLDGAVRRGEMTQRERDWLGIDAWLASQQGLVTREALAAFVEANQVTLQDVVLGEPYTGALSIHEEHTPHGPLFHIVSRTPDGEIDFYYGTSHATRDMAEYVLQKKHAPPGPKFARSRTPGGEHYRELLLTLPTEAKRVDLCWEQQTDDMLIAELPTGRLVTIVYDSERPQDGALLNTTDADGESGERGVVCASVDAAKAAAMDMVRSRLENCGGYRSNHWTQPNVLVHVRFDERSDASGNRVLYLHEIQSDWHQEGRRKGYGSQDLWQVYDENGHLLAQQPTRGDAEAIAADYRAGQTVVQRETGAGGAAAEVRFAPGAVEGVPDAPFKRSEEWAVLAIKRMVRWAVDHGFDRIAWTSGDDAVDVMGVAQQVGWVRWAERSPGSRQVDVFWADPRRDTWRFEVEPDGRVHRDALARANGMRLAGQPLEAILGKALADQVRGEPQGRVDGNGLAVGGDGLRAFYDRIVPAAVNRWARPFGARATAGTVLRTTPEEAAIIAANARSHYGEDSALYQQALSNIRTAAHVLEITPALRDAALAGQPLFRRDPARGDGLSMADATAVAERFMARYRGQVRLGIRIAERQEDLYGPEATIEQQGVIKGGFHADRGLLALVAGNHRDAADVERTLRHEIVGHFGLACLAPADRKGLLRTVIAARESPGLDDLWKRVDAAYPDRSLWERAEEVFAMAAEEPLGAFGKAWNTVLALLARALRRVGLVNEPITLAEVHDLAGRIGDGLRAAGGSAAVGFGANVRDEPGLGAAMPGIASPFR